MNSVTSTTTGNRNFDPGVLEAFKAKAERVGIPYQTLLNSVVKRYTEGKLDIEVA